MNSRTDQQLLRDYTELRSEAAFAELVRRHLDFVYSAALRMVRDTHLAEDVTQASFVALAENAGKLTDHPVLSGWLHRTATNLASKTIRTDVRRRAREEEAAVMNELLAHEPDADWENIAPHLDTALGDLSEPDRDALLLRYFERKSAREMAQVLKVSEEAAQKRVNRAVERLRALFSKRNVSVGASGLAVLISSNAVQAAPVGLIVTLTTSISSGGGSLILWKVMNATKLKFVIGAVVIASATAAFLVQHQAQEKLSSKNQSMAQQLADLKVENNSLSNRLASDGESKSLAGGQFNELLKLRGEVGILRDATNEIGKLRKKIQDAQTQASLEIQQFKRLSHEDQFKLQQMHVGEAMTTVVTAMKSYADNHNEQYASNFDQLIEFGELSVTNFPRNLRLKDFEFLGPEVVNSQGTRLILRARVPLQNSDGKWVWVYGATSGGVPRVEITTAFYGNAVP